MNPFVNIHTHHIDNKEFVEIQNIDVDDFVDTDVFPFCSVGIHPWNADDFDCGRKLSLLKIIVKSKRILAVGETGLDRVCKSDFNKQKEVFVEHIKMSEQISKPLIIHAVRTYPEIISIRKETKAKMPWIIHGFQANMQTAEQLLKHDIYLSLGEVLFKNETRAMQILNIIPIERLFLETDTETWSIVDVYEKMSVLSGLKLDDLRRNIFNNFVKIFGQI